jgi:K+-transporting ATPase A subunit
MLYRIAGIETAEQATWMTYSGDILGVAVMAWTVVISASVIMNSS